LTALAAGPQPPQIRPTDIPTFNPTEAGILDGAAFMAWISTQISAGTMTLALAEGAYHVTPGSDQAHILLSGLSDITVWMDSVNLTMSKVGLTAIDINNCSNLVTYGPTVWWDVPGFSQATITDVEKTATRYFLWSSSSSFVPNPLSTYIILKAFIFMLLRSMPLQTMVVAIISGLQAAISARCGLDMRNKAVAAILNKP